MALPIILNSIDLQGTASTTFKNESKRRQLRLYNEAMETCQSRYNGARACAIVINKTIAAAREGMFPESGMQRLQQATSTALLRTAANKVDDWLGVFVSQPRAYLRIALTIDISLCKGRYAETEDFPKLLLMDEKAGSSIPRALDPVSSLVELDVEGADALVEGNDRRDLDYFDFGLDGKSTGLVGRGDVGVNPWQGQTVDDILGNVLQGAYAPSF
jgi:hypothetical protein